MKVSGNHMQVTRLDAEGNPVGEPFEVSGLISFDLDDDEVTNLDVPLDWREPITIEMNLGAVSPELMTLLYGGSVPTPRKPTLWERIKRWGRLIR